MRAHERRSHRSGLRDQRGQSTLEFALTAVLFIPFTLFFVQISMVLGFANFAHYATFMAARAYTSAGDTPDDQKTRAGDVIKATLKKNGGSGDKFPTIAKAQGGNDVTGMDVVDSQDPATSAWQHGVRYSFRSKIFMVPLMGSGNSAGGGKSDADLVLTAESFLLREPSEQECLTDMRGRSNGMYDNGC